MFRPVSLLAILLTLTSTSVFAQTTAFNYQGQLTDGGNPANATYQMEFKLFNGLAAGTQIGSTITEAAVTVTNGTFGVKLDFGSAAFTGVAVP